MTDMNKLLKTKMMAKHLTIALLLIAASITTAMADSLFREDGKPKGPNFYKGTEQFWYPILAKCMDKDGVQEFAVLQTVDGKRALVFKHRTTFKGTKAISSTMFAAASRDGVEGAREVERLTFKFEKIGTLDFTKLTDDDEKLAQVVLKTQAIIRKACDTNDSTFFDNIKKNVEFIRGL
jgi:hypothetical protein